jgi:UDPglucose--hexose-1-phosphate uridylyltransferase
MIAAFAIILKQLTIKYDNLLRPHFPIRLEFTAPTDGEEHQNGSFTCILPPLLRSATVKKIHGGI